MEKSLDSLLRELEGETRRYMMYQEAIERSFGGESLRITKIKRALMEIVLYERSLSLDISHLMGAGIEVMETGQIHELIEEYDLKDFENQPDYKRFEIYRILNHRIESLERIMRQAGIDRMDADMILAEREHVEALIGSDFPEYVEIILQGLRANMENMHDYFLEGKLTRDYDSNDTLISIYPIGSGSHIAKMENLAMAYINYSRRKGWATEVFFQDPTNIVLKVEGDYPYGYFMPEHGRHRFYYREHEKTFTSFVIVQVEPLLEVPFTQIREDDLSFDFYRGSGPGGSRRNVRETAVRITHVPTGIAAVANRRSQKESRRAAMEVLRSRIAYREELLRGNIMEDYRIVDPMNTGIVRHYDYFRERIYDLRTGVSVEGKENVDDFFNGNLQPFTLSFYDVAEVY